MMMMMMDMTSLRPNLHCIGGWRFRALHVFFFSVDSGILMLSFILGLNSVLYKCWIGHSMRRVRRVGGCLAVVATYSELVSE